MNIIYEIILWFLFEKECPKCGGSGKYLNKHCNNCNGKGRVDGSIGLSEAEIRQHILLESLVFLILCISIGLFYLEWAI